MKIPQIHSNRKQKIIMRITLLLMIFYYCTALFLTGWQIEYAYIECPEDAYTACENYLYDCEHVIFSTYQQDDLCAQDKEKGKKICAKYPHLCMYEKIPKGTYIGEKPPLLIQTLAYVQAIILLTGTIIWYTQGDK